MTKKKLSEKYRSRIPKQQLLKKSDNQQVTVISEFVREFVRRHVDESKRSQSDLYWRPGSGVSHNINLLPQSTQISTSKRKRIATVDDKVKRPNLKRNTSLLKSLMIKKPTVISSDLCNKLHHLWNGYFQSVMSVLLNKLNTPSFNVKNNLDTVLRLNFIGAHMKVLRSTSCRAGIEGIVVMETKNTFTLALNSSENQLTSSSSSTSTQSLLSLTTVPKSGSLFSLRLSQLIPKTNSSGSSGNKCQSVDVLLNGDLLNHRAVDRTIRKWRYTPTTAYEYNQNALTTEAIFSNLLIDNVIIS
ncbi:Ribonuclease P subunit p29 [Schistosoma japonicum]|uniref:Ribonuclease P protein subunit p29 n=1 Tax=Schistosoma japonicum TaxID=6182 RepID=A0A4Z2DQK3_SCHJA|nr:Ribonuclease P subunit p29 [Schistosoma japonicum]